MTTAERRIVEAMAGRTSGMSQHEIDFIQDMHAMRWSRSELNDNQRQTLRRIGRRFGLCR
jgi:hypothetical protein